MTPMTDKLKVRQYFRNLWLWAHVSWLWRRDLSTTYTKLVIKSTPTAVFSYGMMPVARCIAYKSGWTPKRMLVPYLTTYLLGALAGYGVVSLSRVWFEKSQCKTENYRFAKLMTRLLDFFTRKAQQLSNSKRERHGANAGRILWGSQSVRKHVCT